MKTTELLEAALAARENAYAPYSGFKVGAALVSSASKTVYSGCNVENASYGATICAERGAVMKAMSEEGHLSVKALLVVSDAAQAAVPCAVCLQVLSEFCSAETPVYVANLSGIVQTYTFGELLPVPFNSIPE
ncbi:cytidine deaminase [Sediminispirochaeta bajacaliforniensis]|uniref:cytidine deaminase n=1 Tax=Sediminispirochaeta bajacaliforniensis TaxID=148 RepID=UPI0003664BFE|nr:cytidine deaminase [Sediminispirochaeta bajacaliforniensis]